ncbi:histone-lysine N-methyltransferase set1-like isoform X1 [Leptopilina boulardi]|uniref:histone-lysine N-methyltransferase set1-like isoform X1 n=1 Tax=Leptopilina boulardi TaxID=63433 RepID=UPI0021F673F3|nr:histone-lysine N-methyltransferase set1-like isoform X1 [Leptopilina boulardi]
MTVMPSSSDVADKAVSTEDASCGVEVSSIDALLAALVETKVEAIKASSSSIITRRFGSAPASPRRPRLTSSSTVSSSQNHHHHHHHHCHPDHRYHGDHHHHHHCDHGDCHDHHQRHQNYHQEEEELEEEEDHREHHRHGRRYEKKKRERHRRHGSAPCGEFIENPRLLQQGHRSDKGKRRASECPRSPSKKRKYSKSSYVLEEDILDLPLGLDTPFEHLGIDGDQDLGLINLIRSREAFSDICEYPRLHQSACYTSQNEAQLKLDYDEDDDFLALNLEDELDDNETLSNPEKVNKPIEKFHRPRKKRKRRIKKIEPEIVIETDPDELPPRARMTIVATACLLLAMSLLLVGITLRMGPIIDEMVRKENEALMNSLNHDSSVQENSTTSP